MIIVPGRLNSSRFENKILVDIFGVPMIIATANRVKDIDQVIIATDSQEVVKLANRHGFKAVFTSSAHKSGTDRINEAVDMLGLKDHEIVLNVQADEPFIEPEVVKKVLQNTKKFVGKNGVLLSSCYKSVSSEIADDPNHVKVVLDENSHAIYFSRSKIPHHKDHYSHTDYKGHLGIYGFTVASLKTFCSLKHSKLEHIEKLEQLRVIEAGYKISMIEVNSQSFGIDTKEDLNMAMKMINDKKGNR
ncbi:MAG: 3-deoxy-manno-octulosonate cytidylyltransferase [Epsilonproteobacteria bacterium]|nr:MAG: 3-deoxy-manno-octulosonate cytidylyltransferase [Campylobacterota bacterium]